MNNGPQNASAPSRAPATKLPLSVIVTTLNERTNIAACLASVEPIVAEMIVVDCGSTDGTVELAREAGATVHVTRDWPGFGPQKNRALALATQPWVLSIDADERLSPALAGEIADAVSQARHAGYEIPRLSQFCGHWVRHSGWYPDYVLRLFKRGAGRFSDHLVHERVLVDGTLGRLHEQLLHYSYTTMAQVQEKSARYAKAGAEELFRRGVKVSPLTPWYKSGWAFVRAFVLQRGFMDGWAGFAISRSHAHTTYSKYQQLRALRRQP